MDYFELYKRTIKSEGNSLRESRVNNATKHYNKLFDQNVNYRIAEYIKFIGTDQSESTELEVVFQLHDKKSNTYTNTNHEQRTFLLRPHTSLELGRGIRIDAGLFLIYDKTDSLEFPTYYTIKSNYHLKILIGEEEGEIVDYDRFNRPIYGESTSIYYERPAHVSSTMSNVFTEFDSKVNLPDGRLFVYVPYDDDFALSDGDTFEMYGDTYQIGNVDLSAVYHNEGIAKLLVNKTTSLNS